MHTHTHLGTCIKSLSLSELSPSLGCLSLPHLKASCSQPPGSSFHSLVPAKTLTATMVRCESPSELLSLHSVPSENHTTEHKRFVFHCAESITSIKFSLSSGFFFYLIERTASDMLESRGRSKLAQDTSSHSILVPSTAPFVERGSGGVPVWFQTLNVKAMGELSFSFGCWEKKEGEEREQK